MSEEKLNEQLNAVEALLASFKPAPLEADRDRVMFLAGRVSAPSAWGGRRFAAWAWPGALAGMTAVAATLLVMLVTRGDPEVADGTHAESLPSDFHQGDVDPGSGPPAHAAEQRPATPPVVPKHKGRLPAGATYDELFERIAADGFDAWERPDPAAVRQPAVGPVTCRKWLEMLSQAPDSTDPLNDWKVFSRQRGGES